MKTAVSLGVLGILLGYLVGVNQDKPAEDQEVKVEVESSSRQLTGKGERRSREASSRKATDRQYERVRELAKFGRMVGGTEEARLIHWILELEAGDFPEILETLGDIRSSRNDPFSKEHRKLLSIALVRWYELEGDQVTSWLTGNKKIAEGREVVSWMREMISDRFVRDPRGALEEVRRYGAVMKADGYWAVTEWAELVGRYSLSMNEDLAAVRDVAEVVGLGGGDSDPFFAPDPFSEPDPFAAEEEEISPEDLELRLNIAVCEGLIKAGKIEEVREFSSGFDSEGRNYVEELIQDRELNSMRGVDWRELKQVVEHGILQDNALAERQVLEHWSKENPKEAMDWFIQKGKDQESRSSRIARVVRDWEDYSDSSGFTEEEIYREKIEFLEQRSLEGDRVTQGWDALMSRAQGYDNWDRVLELQGKVSQEAWNETLKEVRNLGAKDSLWIGRERFELRRLDEMQLETLEKFALKEEVQSAVELQNQKAFEKLGEAFDVE